MTSKNLAEAKLRQTLVDEHGIKFLPDVDPEKWPSNHKKHFRNIHRLGETRFDVWKKDAPEPLRARDWWKIGMQNRARRIVQNARECRDHQPNERTWRSHIEPDVFLSLSEDVSCQHCSLRIRRPEIDPRMHSDELFTRDLRLDKDSCQCPQHCPPHARAEHRSAKLFAMREDTRVEYGADVQKRLKRKWEAPDTVFALKVSGTLKEKLTALNRKGATVGKTLMACLNPTLFPNEAHPIVFPFLLGESKSESSCGSFTRINLQMALVIEESLNIQERLRQMAGEECEWVAGPLVWCLSHHGPTWRLSAGYMRTRGKVKIEITTLWQGLITDHNGAIQLLLIVEYITDWARYIHREAIIRELQAMALPSVDTVSDILSSTGLTVDSYHGHRNQSEVSPVPSHRGLLSLAMPSTAHGQDRLDRVSLWQEAQNNANSSPAVRRDPLRNYDKRRAVVRSTSLIRSRVVGVFVTTTNFNKVADCIVEKQGSFRRLSNMLTRLEQEHPLYLDRSTLGDIEMMWSGHRQGLQPGESPQDEFHVLFTISHYVGSDWGLNRDISFLAISEKAKDLFYEKVRGGQNKPWKRRGHMIARDWGSSRLCSLKTIKEAIDIFHKASADSILPACLDRLSVGVRIDTLQGRISADNMMSWATFKSGSEQCHIFETTPALSRRVRKILRHRQQKSHPGLSNPLIQTSSRRDDQSLIHRSNIPGRHRVMVYEPSTNEPTLALAERAGPVNSLSTESRSSRHCIYVTDELQLDRLTRDFLKGKKRFDHRLETQRVSSWSEETIQWNTPYTNIGGLGTTRFLKPFFQGLRQQREQDSFPSRSKLRTDSGSQPANQNEEETEGSDSEESDEEEGEEEDDDEEGDEDYQDDDDSNDDETETNEEYEYDEGSEDTEEYDLD